VSDEPKGLAFLDVNVPMYAAGTDHPYRDACRWIMTEIAEERRDVAIDVEIIQEILHRYGALGRHAEAVTVSNDVIAIVPSVFAITLADVQAAVELFRQYAPRGLQARDVLHLAVMLNNGLTDIISADGHFDLVPGIQRFDPIDLYRRAHADRADTTE